MFTFTTVYDQNATTAMAKAVRKTVRKKKDRRGRIFSVVALTLMMLLTIPFDGKLVVDFRLVFCWITGLILIVALLFTDHINGFAAQKRIMSGVEEDSAVFSEEDFWSETAKGKTQRQYDSILMIAETDGYFVFVYDQRYAQCFDKKSISGGTVDEFRSFISEKTQKPVQKV